MERKEFEKSLQLSEEEEFNFKKQQSIAKLEYRNVLHEQMVHKFLQKQEEHKALLKERKVLEDAVKTLMDEDERFD